MGHIRLQDGFIEAAVGIYCSADDGKVALRQLNDISVCPLYQSFCESSLKSDDMSSIGGWMRDHYRCCKAGSVVADTNSCRRWLFWNVRICLRWLKDNVVFWPPQAEQQYDWEHGKVLSYIEPLCVISCEMVSEVLQYITDDVEKLAMCGSNSMYAEFRIDTKQFGEPYRSENTEALHFWEGCERILTVRKIFRDNMNLTAKARLCEKWGVLVMSMQSQEARMRKIDSPTPIGTGGEWTSNIDGIKAFCRLAGPSITENGVARVRLMVKEFRDYFCLNVFKEADIWISPEPNSSTNMEEAIEIDVERDDHANERRRRYL